MQNGQIREVGRSPMATMIERIDRALYPNFERNWDDRAFRLRVLQQLGPDSLVLDLGAGAGLIPEMNFRGLAKLICGVDLDPRVLKNALLDEGRVADAQKVPYENDHFDVVFSDNVLEHLDKPETVFREVARVLKPGGVFLFKTPNEWHYMPAIARLTPHRFHQRVNRWRGRRERDIFPTHYRANSRRAIERLAKGSGLQVEKFELIEGRPEYLRFAWLPYLLGAGYERLINSNRALAGFRILIIGALRKPAS
jgi:SAM-dependent methyltransferase